MGINPGMLSSKNPAWGTPWGFFERLDREFGFDLDVCASPDNAKCEAYFDEMIDGLKQSWAPAVCYMNPPYGRQIIKWVRKAYEEGERGAVVVCLLPARVDTIWWHAYCMKAREIRLVIGRLIFQGAKKNAPFPSVIVVFGPGQGAPRWGAMQAGKGDQLFLPGL